MSLRDRHVVLGVCGSIAAYKAADLTSKLVQAGAMVDVVLTQGVALDVPDEPMDPNAYASIEDAVARRSTDALPQGDPDED